MTLFGHRLLTYVVLFFYLLERVVPEVRPRASYTGGMHTVTEPHCLFVKRCFYYCYYYYRNRVRDEEKERHLKYAPLLMKHPLCTWGPGAWTQILMHGNLSVLSVMPPPGPGSAS